ncbi:MAG: hypothetical protein ACSLE6_08070 [Mycobacterium sp.]
MLGELNIGGGHGIPFVRVTASLELRELASVETHRGGQLGALM